MTQSTPGSSLADLIGMINGLEIPATSSGNVLTLRTRLLADLVALGLAASSSVWQLVTTRVVAANPEIFLNLSAYNELLIITRLLTEATSNPPFIQVSSDNGGTYIGPGSYFQVGNLGAETGGISGIILSQSTTAARTNATHIYNWNQTTGIKFSESPASNVAGNLMYVIDTALALNAFQILNNTNNLTGGTVYVYGR